MGSVPSARVVNAKSKQQKVTTSRRDSFEAFEDDDALIKASMRLSHFRESARRGWVVARLSIIFALIVSVLAGFFSLRELQPRYFAVSQDGKYTELTPLSNAMFSDEIVSQWSNHALVDTFNFNYSDFQIRLNEALKEYFTAEGGESLLIALDRENILKDVKEGQFFVSLVVRDNPIITAKSNNGPIAAWKLEAPVILTYRSDEGVSSQDLVIELTITRRDVLKYPSGLGVAQILMTPDK